jgi:hypothetical protein
LPYGKEDMLAVSAAASLSRGKYGVLKTLFFIYEG